MSFSDFTTEQRSDWAKALWMDPEKRSQMVAGMRHAWLYRPYRIVVTDAILTTICACNDGITGQRETARRLRIGRHSLREILRTHGIEWKRPPGGAPSVQATPEILAAIYKARLAGLSLTVAAETIGIARNTLRRLIAEHGIPWTSRKGKA